VVNFKDRLAGKKAEKPTDPVKLYETLDRAVDKGPLRPAQLAVLKEWFSERQTTRDESIRPANRPGSSELLAARPNPNCPANS
jgi:hypothetical protein